MATIALSDRRRPDMRHIVQPAPFWATSFQFDYTAAAKGVALFGFINPIWGPSCAIHAAILEILTPFAGGTPSIDIGEGTIPQNVVSSTDVITIVDADSIIPSADITEGTAGLYPALTGAAVTLWAAGQMKIITCADTVADKTADVTVLYATLSSGLTAGVARLHIMASVIPVAGHY